MQKLLLLALCFVSAFSAKIVTIAASATMDAVALQERANYVKAANQMYFCSFDAPTNTYTSSIRHNLPDLTKVKSLTATWYGKNAAGQQVDPPTLTLENTGGYMFIKVTYTAAQLVDAYGCIDMPANTAYVGKICTHTIDYIAPDQGAVVMTTDFSTSIKIPKNAQLSVTTSATKIYKKGCDCEILSALPLSIAIFSDDGCTVPFTGTSFTYGSRVCLKVSSSSSLASTYYFDLTSILMNYPTNGVQTSQEIKAVSKVQCGTPATGCIKGSASASFDMLAVGSPVSFTITVVLRDQTGRRLLADEVMLNKGLQGSTPEIPITQGDTPPTPTPTPTPTPAGSSAAGLTVTLLSFLAILLFFI